MKKLEIIIKPEKLEDLKALLDSEEVNGLNIVNSMGYGNQKGIIKITVVQSMQSIYCRKLK